MKSQFSQKVNVKNLFSCLLTLLMSLPLLAQDCETYTMNLVSPDYMDGWNADEFYSLVGGNGVLADHVTLEEGDFMQYEYCLEPGCYMLQFYHEGYSNSSFTFEDNLGNVIAESYGYFGLGHLTFSTDGNENCELEFLGCTDYLAPNYNEYATVNDGSCESATDCEMVSVVLGGVNDWVYMDLNVQNENGDIIFTETLPHSDLDSLEFDLCLSSGCYSILTDGYQFSYTNKYWTIYSESDEVLLSSSDLNPENIQTQLIGDIVVQSGNVLSINSDCTPHTTCEGVLVPLAASPHADLSIINGEDLLYDVDGQFSGEVCLQEDICYTIDMNGDSWWGSLLTIGDAVYYGPNYYQNSLDYSVNGICSNIGCTDSYAVNYNPMASVDDGSCHYGCDLIDTITGIGYYYSTSTIWWDIPNELQALRPLVFSITDLENNLLAEQIYINNVVKLEPILDTYLWPNDLVMQMTFEGNDSVYCSTSFSLSDIGSYFGCTSPSAVNYDSTAYINVGCEFNIQGCIDSLASNYNAEATEDDGSCTYVNECPSGQTSVLVSVEGPETVYNYGNIIWTLKENDQTVLSSSSAAFNSNNTSINVCLSEDVCYVLDVWAGYFSDWGENSLIIGDSVFTGPVNYEQSFSLYSLDNTCVGIEGCTSFGAINYNQLATIDDGSCDFGCQDLIVTNLEMNWYGEIELTVENNSSNQFNYTYFTIYDTNDSVLAQNSGMTIAAGASRVIHLDPLVAAEEWPSEIEIRMSQYYGQADFECILPYNDYAGLEYYSCTEVEVPIIVGGAEESINSEYDFGWNITDGESIIFEGNVPFDGTVCLQEGICYTVNMLGQGGVANWYGNTVTLGEVEYDEPQLGGGVYTYADVYSVDNSCNNELIGCTDSSASNYDAEATEDDGSCEYAVEGCTNLNAINYNPEATIDNGSCEFETSNYTLDWTAPGNTGNNHTIFVNTSTQVLVNGNQVVPGSAVGAFYTNSEGNHMCAGYSTVGNDFGTFAVWGDDNATSVIDGYEVGEEFWFVIWDASTGQEYTAEVTYLNGVTAYQQWGFTSISGFDAIALNTEVSGCMNPNATNYISNATIDDGSCTYEGPNWTFDITGGNHTVLLTESTEVLIDGVAASVGSALGLFFVNSEGTPQCAGFTTLNGEAVQIAVMADDTTTPEIDGYIEGEEFWYVLWDANTGQEWTASASYVSGENIFSLNAISVLATLNVSTGPTEQMINLPLGWSSFSTYMASEGRALTEILSSANDKVVIVKDYMGNAFLPEWSFDGIGALTDGQGYQIKTTGTCEFTISGVYLSPEENPISLVQGWNLVAYLRTEPSEVSAVFADLASDDNLVIVKDYMGNAYLPEWNFNGIGEMLAGQAYQLKVNTAAELSYLPSNEQYRFAFTEVTNNESILKRSLVVTDNNMQIVLEDHVWDVTPSEESDILAYDAKGTLIGAVKYTRPTTVLTVWGDDVHTTDKDGLFPQETIDLVLWSNKSKQRLKIDSWEEGSGLYIANSIQVIASISNESIKLKPYLKVRPNPALSHTQIEFSLPEEMDVEVGIYTVLGEKLRIVSHTTYSEGVHKLDINLEQFEAGTYLIEFISNEIHRSEYVQIIK